MRLKCFTLSSAAAVAITGVVMAAAYFYKSCKVEINEVMVFCKLQFNAYNCFDKLMGYVEAAKKSVNVCMPSIHNPAIQARLVKLIKEKNIKVRIIIDRNGYRESTDFFLKELINAGAEIKCRVNELYNMQPKFCLVDDEVLLSGTLNWGDDRSCDHWNYVYITNKTQLVDPVKTEFYQTWAKGMDMNDPLQIQPIFIGTDELQTQKPDITEENRAPSVPPQTPILRETQVTPELCIT